MGRRRDTTGVVEEAERDDDAVATEGLGVEDVVDGASGFPRPPPLYRWDG